MTGKAIHLTFNRDAGHGPLTQLCGADENVFRMLAHALGKREVEDQDRFPADYGCAGTPACIGERAWQYTGAPATEDPCRARAGSRSRKSCRAGEFGLTKLPPDTKMTFLSSYPRRTVGCGRGVTPRRKQHSLIRCAMSASRSSLSRRPGWAGWFSSA